MIKKLSKLNYFVALMILLGITLALGLASFILVASLPGTLGAAPPHYEIKEVYEFEPWSFEVGGLSASYPDGGLIVPIFLEDKQEAVILVGAGEYTSPGQPLPLEAPLGLYLDIDFDLFSEVRGDVIFIPVEDAASRDLALRVYQKQPGLPVLWKTGIPLVFFPCEHTVYYYFIDSTGAPLLPPTVIEPAGFVWGIMVLYALFAVMALMTVLTFSLDYHPSRYWKYIHCARPRWPVAAAAAGAAAIALFAELLPAITGLDEMISSLGYALTISALILMARLKLIDFLDFGLRPDTARHGYLMAAAVTVLLMVMTRGFPERLQLNGLSTLVDFLMFFFLAALTREMIWRGFIQTTLGRILGAGPGLITTAVLAGLVHYAVLSLTASWVLDYPYVAVETFILVPGTALILGSVYLRTENILSNTLLHCLILFLPRIIAG